MNIGDYVRTKNYGITKILNIYNSTTTNYISITLDKIDSFGRLGVSVGDNEIIKSSKRIIDLVQVGDYANGDKVLEVLLDDTMSRVKTELATYFNNDIKSIVTKEQFESMEYKVGE